MRPLVRSNSIRLNATSGAVGLILVGATSCSDVFTKLTFQMLDNEQEARENVVSPTAAVLILFTVVIATMALPALVLRVLLSGGCPASTRRIPWWLWPLLGLVMLTQILMAALTFVFLPAAVVSSLNIGLSILLTSGVRSLRQKTRYPASAWLALASVALGCVVVAVQHYFAEPSEVEDAKIGLVAAKKKYMLRALGGFVCVLLLASSTALAGTLDDWLTKDKEVESDFLATAQASSASVYVLFAVKIWMMSNGVVVQDIVGSLQTAWNDIEWFPQVAFVTVIAQFMLKVLAVFVTSLSSAVTAQVFLALSMVSTWCGSSALHWWWPEAHVGDTCSGTGAFFRAAGMILVLSGVTSFLGVCSRYGPCSLCQRDYNLVSIESSE